MFLSLAVLGFIFISVTHCSSLTVPYKHIDTDMILIGKNYAKYIFTMLSLAIHEHGVSYNLFRSLSISFIHISFSLQERALSVFCELYA